jgi:hypothetical protein
MFSIFPKLPLLGSPQVTINMNNRQNKNQPEFKIQTTNCPMAYPYL